MVVLSSLTSWKISRWSGHYW